MSENTSELRPMLEGLQNLLFAEDYKMNLEPTREMFDELYHIYTKYMDIYNANSFRGFLEEPRETDCLESI